MQRGFCHWLLVCDAGMFRFGIVAVAGLAASLWSVLEAQETHPFSVHDMLAMERLSDPQMSPDGSVVAFTVRSTDLAANNPQAYAGAGFAAVMIDFHGSVGYGQDFTDSIRGDWGGKPLEDLQKGLAAALDLYPFLDGDRVCALGASYGGYMVNWIAGAWPDRFRCLVNHDGVFDLRSMYYTTEELWFVEWDHEGSYFDNPDGFESHNPAPLVDRWQTPMLVIHGALDFRVPETQGLAVFTALRRRDVPARFLYFPDENHWVLGPANSVQWHEEVLGWLARWLEP